jgi:hypothetical protein
MALSDDVTKIVNKFAALIELEMRIRLDLCVFVGLPSCRSSDAQITNTWSTIFMADATANIAFRAPRTLANC